MAIIAIRDLWKRFTLHHQRPRTLKEALVHGWGQAETFWALQGVGLEVQPGEALGVIGGNGSGKSTLLKLVAGILQPDRGELAVGGRVSALLELGAGFHPDFTGRENVFLNGVMLGLSRREVAARFDAIVAFAEMERFIDTPVKHYSSGMFMRLAFAVAVHVDPDILLIDEVLAVGDAAFQRKCMARIEEFKQAGTTLLFVSHDLNAVRQTCDRLAWLQDGRLRATGSTADVLAAYVEELYEQPPGQGVPWPVVRSGSREIEIVGARWLDPAGAETRLLRAGEPATLAVSYAAREPIPRPVFGIGIRRGDGLHCYGTNTSLDGLAVPPLSGAGEVRLRFEGLPYFSGTYLLDVAIHDVFDHVYDSFTPYLAFHVQSNAPGIGVASLPHRWEVPAGQG